MARMSLQGAFMAVLDESERRLVRSLREIPPSPLRDRMAALIDEIVGFTASPGCPEVQADGVPCGDVQMSCDRCRQTIGLLDGLRSRLRER